MNPAIIGGTPRGGFDDQQKIKPPCPALLNHDYDFFISRSRGYLPMMVVCYGFIVACWILMAAGFTAAGVAIADLYRVGKSNGISGLPEGN